MTNGLAIVKITDKEKEQILSSSSNAFHFSFPDITHKSHALELVINVDKIVGDIERPEGIVHPIEQARKNFEEVVTALRIFKSGVAGFNPIWVSNTAWQPHGGIFSYFTFATSYFFGKKYQLSDDEETAFLSLWQQYNTITSLGRNTVLRAAKRINTAPTRGDVQDKLVDFFIAFEGLLLERKSGELKYKHAMRGAHLLGTTPEERKNTFDVLSKGYDQRSDIVHGEAVTGTIHIGERDFTLPELTDEVERCLREALKRFIIDCSNPDTSEEVLLKQLNQRILE